MPDFQENDCLRKKKNPLTEGVPSSVSLRGQDLYQTFRISTEDTFTKLNLSFNYTVSGCHRKKLYLERSFTSVVCRCVLCG